MIRRFKHIVILSLIFFVSIGYIKNGCAQLLDIQTKSMDGEVRLLRDRMDSNTHYLIETMAFWCAPCVRSIDKFNAQKEYWKERYNVEVILLVDKHFNDLEYIQTEMDNFGWDLEIFATNNAFGPLGINSIPRYFLVNAGTYNPVKVSSQTCGGYERLFQIRLENTHLKSVFNSAVVQTVVNIDCASTAIDVNLNTLIDDVEYAQTGTLLLTEDSITKSIYYLNDNNSNEKYLDYTLGLCESSVYTDFEGDEMTAKIMEISKSDTTIILTTDKYIKTNCFQDSVPFTLIQGIGTNAGLLFDIEDGGIVSRLACHTSNVINYQDEELKEYCQPTSTFEDNEIGKLLIIPNPSDGFFRVDFPFRSQWILKIMTIDGIAIKVQNSHTKALDMNMDLKLNSGAYIIECSTNNKQYFEMLIVN